jgi:hypothetical protein
MNRVAELRGEGTRVLPVGMFANKYLAGNDKIFLVPWMLKGERIVVVTATEVRMSDGLAFYRNGRV